MLGAIFLLLTINSIQTTPARDPFYLPSELKEIAKKKEPKLLGIISSEENFKALLSFNGESKTVSINDKFYEYEIKEIKQNYVIIRGKDGNNKKLE